MYRIVLAALSCAAGWASPGDGSGPGEARRAHAFGRPYVDALFRAVYPTVRLSSIDRDSWHHDLMWACAELYRSRPEVGRFYRRISVVVLKALVEMQNPLQHLSRITYDTIGQQRNNLFAHVVALQLGSWNRMDEFSYFADVERFSVEDDEEGDGARSHSVEYCMRGRPYDNVYSTLFSIHDLKRRKIDEPLAQMLRAIGALQMWIYSSRGDLAKIEPQKWTSRHVECDPDESEPDPLLRNAPGPSLYSRLAAWWLAADRRDGRRRRWSPDRARAPTLHAIVHKWVASATNPAAPQRPKRHYICVTVFDVTWAESDVRPPDSVEEFRYSPKRPLFGVLDKLRQF